MAELSTLEKDCIKNLAKLYHDGKTYWSDDDGLESLGLNEGNRRPVLGLMESMGVIANVGHISECPFCHFTIMPKVIVVERELREQEEKAKEGEDIVESVKKYLRRNWVTASIVAAFLLVSFLLGILNNLLGVLKGLGVIDPAK
jgi:hypothetical protein